MDNLPEGGQNVDKLPEIFAERKKIKRKYIVTLS